MNRSKQRKQRKKEKSLCSLRSLLFNSPSTARSAWQLARKHAVVTPVIDETYAMLYEAKDIRQAVRDLMARELRAED